MNFNFFFFFFFWGGGGGGFTKIIFLGYEDFVDIFCAITKSDYIKGSFLCILGSFLRSRYRIGDIFWGC